MNQIRIKWIFVIVFLAINLFFGNMLYQSQFRANSISEETVVHTVSVLQKKGVTVPGSLIPHSRMKMKEGSVRNITESSSAFFASLPNSGWDRQEDGAYRRGQERLWFADGRVHYEGQTPIEKGLSGERLDQAVQKQLKRLSFPTDGLKLKTIEQKENGAVLAYVQSYDGYEIFGTELTVLVEDSAVRQGDGILLEPVNTKARRMATVFATEALLQFAESGDRPQSVQVTDLKNGYYISEISEPAEHKVMQMLPVFQITAASGEQYYYDARSSGE